MTAVLDNPMDGRKARTHITLGTAIRVTGGKTGEPIETHAHSATDHMEKKLPTLSTARKEAMRMKVLCSKPAATARKQVRKDHSFITVDAAHTTQTAFMLDEADSTRSTSSSAAWMRMSASRTTGRPTPEIRNQNLSQVQKKQAKTNDGGIARMHAKSATNTTWANPTR